MIWQSGAKSIESEEALYSYRLRGYWLAFFAVLILVTDLLSFLPALPEGQAEISVALPVSTEACPAPEYAVFYGAPLDVNHADAQSLTLLPGIGPVLAKRILAAREADGPFATTDALLKVPGIGPVTLARLAPHICIK